MSESEFHYPDFAGGNLELRFEDDTVCIYGTASGLRSLAELILDLVGHPNQGHIHLESPELQLLTPESEKGAIAIFS